MNEYFTKAEAEAKVGRTIRTLRAWSGVPEGATGTVIKADSMGKVKPASQAAYEVYDVVIQWNVPTAPPAIAEGAVDGEPVTFMRSGKPLVDWFTKAEYERYLVEETH